MKKIVKKVIAMFLTLTMFMGAANGITYDVLAGDTLYEVISNDNKEDKSLYDMTTVKYNGKTYEFVNRKTDSTEGFSWYEAENICEKWGGHLATITDDNERKMVTDCINNDIADNASNNYWMGAYRDVESGVWKWVSGEKWDYTYWGYNEPNNYRGYIESYAHVIGKYYSAIKTVGVWNDSSNTGAGYANSFYNQANYGFICEYDEYSGSNSYIYGDFKFEPYIQNESGTDTASQFYFRDDYFMNGTSEYNSSLATMSLCMAVAAFDSSDSGQGNISDLLSKDKLNFKDPQIDNYGSTSESSIGSVISHKTILVGGKETELISVVVRGGGYGREWSGNFDIGLADDDNGGEHNGFSKAANKVAKRLSKYIDDKLSDKTDMILWVTGYSRAAATSNLLSGRIDSKRYSSMGDDYKNLDKFGTDNLYAYCFETPQGTLENIASANSSACSNIFNVINNADVVTYVAPSTAPFNFTRYGKDFILPSVETSSNYTYYEKNMIGCLKTFFDTNGYKLSEDDILENVYPVDNYSTSVDAKSSLKSLDFDNIIHTAPMGTNISNIVDSLAVDMFKSRTNYVNSYEQTLRAVIAIAQCKAVQNSISKSLSGTKSEIENIFSKYIKKLALALWQRDKNKVETIVGTIINEIVDTLNVDIKQALQDAEIYSYSGEPLDDVKKLISGVLCDFALNNPYKAIDLAINATKLFSPHYPENELAWLQACDPNYMHGVQQWTGISSYRKLNINCPIDVIVYDGDGNIVAKITDNEPVILDGGISTYIDYDGQKVVCLPNDGEYNVKMTATDKGSMSCTLEEYSSNYKECSKIANYYDIPLSKGEDFNLYAPANVEMTPEGSNYQYTIDTDNNKKSPDEIFAGNEIENNDLSVEVYSMNDNFGCVSGSGNRNKGSFANVIATAKDGYKFQGWYDAEKKLLSNESEYRFRVDNNVKLYADFVKDEEGSKDATKTVENTTSTKVSKSKPEKVKKLKVKRLSSKKAKISWKSNSKAKYYIVQYSMSKKFSSNKKYKTKTKTTKKTSVILKTLKKSKLYFIRVRAVASVNGKQLKGKWSEIKKAKVIKD